MSIGNKRYRMGSRRFFYEIHEKASVVYMTAADDRGSAYRQNYGVRDASWKLLSRGANFVISLLLIPAPIGYSQKAEKILTDVLADRCTFTSMCIKPFAT